MFYSTSRAIHIWRRSLQYACPRTRFSLFVFHDGLSAILFYYFLSLLDPTLLPLLHPAHVFFIYTPESAHRSGRLNGKQYGNSITFRKRTKKKKSVRRCFYYYYCYYLLHPLALQPVSSLNTLLFGAAAVGVVECCYC